MASDNFGRLICDVPGCGAVIPGMTGLIELQNLRKHMGKKHKQSWNMEEALEERVKIEQSPEKLSKRELNQADKEITKVIG